MFARFLPPLLLVLTFAAQAADIRCPPEAVPQEAQAGSVTEAWCELAADRTQLHGPYRAWYGNGVLGTEEHYQHGKASGKAAYRWGSGHRQAEGNYKDGVRDGLWNFWDKTGMKAGQVRYQNGALVSGTLPKWANDWDARPAARRP